jgi:hypothetical protein
LGLSELGKTLGAGPKRGQVERGIAQMREGLAAMRATGCDFRRSSYDAVARPPVGHLKPIYLDVRKRASYVHLRTLIAPIAAASGWRGLMRTLNSSGTTTDGT